MRRSTALTTSGAAIAGAIVAPILAPVVLGAFGFSAAGVVAGRLLL